MKIIKATVILIVNAIVWSSIACENYNEFRDKSDSSDSSDSSESEEYEIIKCVCKPLSRCTQLYANYDKYIKHTCILSKGGQGICCPQETTNDDDAGSMEEFPNLNIKAFQQEISYSVPNLTQAEIEVALQKAQESQEEGDRISDELVKEGIVIEPGTPAGFHVESLKPSDDSLNVSNLVRVAISEDAGLTPRLDNKEERYFCPKPPSCKDNKYRTQDGSCNNLKHGKWGKASTPVTRILRPDYADGIKKPRIAANGKELPSARVISLTVIQDVKRPDPKVTSSFTQFGQFLDHDLSLSPVTSGKNNVAIKCCDPKIIANPHLRHPECFEIKIPKKDPFYSRFNQTCMEFVRTLAARRTLCDFGPREQVNQLTSFVDGSMIYGSSDKEAKALRTFRGGKLRSEHCKGKQLLPFEKKEQSCSKPNLTFKAGDARVNVVTMLTMYHTLFLRFHNNVADQLQKLNPRWNDERVFQETRRFVGATLQHITYTEFLPTLIGLRLMKKLDLLPKERGSSNSYNPSTNPSIINDFTTAGYRLHTLVQADEEYVDRNRKIIEKELIRNTFNKPGKIATDGHFDNLLRGSTVQPSQKFDNYLTKELTNYLFRGNQPFGLDLASLNIQRGRDHGLRAYKDYRKVCGLRPLKSFKEMEKVMIKGVASRLKQVYRSVNDIDFWVGGTSEQPMRGAVVGPTFACIIGEQFRRLKFGDRYWYENGNQKSSFSEGQLQAIRDMSLARVICDNGDKIRQTQPLPFYKPTKYNKITSCRSPAIPKMNLTSWKVKK